MTLSPAQRSLRARIGAHAQHAAHDTRDTTKAARSAFLENFYNQVDPDRQLSEQERERRAAAKRSEHFARMAFRRHRRKATGI